MTHTQLATPHRPHHDVPEEWEPPDLPVEPDEGLIPPAIPDDPEHERLIDPAAMRQHEGLHRDLGVAMGGAIKAERAVADSIAASGRHRHTQRELAQAKRRQRVLDLHPICTGAMTHD